MTWKRVVLGVSVVAVMTALFVDVGPGEKALFYVMRKSLDAFISSQATYELDKKANALYPGGRGFGQFRTLNTDPVNISITNDDRPTGVSYTLPKNYIDGILANKSWRGGDMGGVSMMVTFDALEPINWDNKEVFLKGGLEGRISISISTLDRSQPRWWVNELSPAPFSILGNLTGYKSPDPVHSSDEIYIGKRADGSDEHIICTSKEWEVDRGLAGKCIMRYMYGDYIYFKLHFLKSNLPQWIDIKKRVNRLLTSFEVK